ncbi:MAG: 30S ribosomal protein S2 [Clostridia bacterium]|nr:30S ribosomal protein S2 [Clostridia bacterium]
MSVISMKQLLEAGVHFGHQSRKWNPKMKEYIFTARNDIHIINLELTSEQVDKAYTFVRDVVASGKSVLFVGTKKQAQEAVKEEAERCGMFYVNTRWLGGTLTNFKTIRNSIERLNKLNQMEKVGEFDLLPKKEVSLLKVERDKLEKNLGGIKDMRELPGVIFVVDPTNEKICVHEANILHIPVVSLVDTNCDPSHVDVVIPGNDDAIRSVKLIAGAIADAVIEAREGVSMKKDDEENADEALDLEALLEQAKPTADVAEAGEETKKSDKKPRKKPAVKKETKAENTTEAKAEEKPVEEVAEAPAEEKPAKSARARKPKTTDAE